MNQPSRVKEPASDRGVHPFVWWMWRRMKDMRVSQSYVADKAGLDTSTLRKWRQGWSSPKLRDMEAVANVLGARLVIQEADNDN